MSKKSAPKKEVKEVKKEAVVEALPQIPSAKKSEGSDIASAIVAGLAASKEDKTIKIVGDDSVASRFTVVKNAEGEIMLRENETGALSGIQFHSVEEKEALSQNQEVSEV